MSWATAALRRAGGVRRTADPVISSAPAKTAPPAITSPYPPGPEKQASLRDWAGVLAMVFGMFLSIMDIQIVTSSLAQIQGGLSATADEIGWVQTSYLIAEVVMIPLSGTLSRLLSTRVLFVISALGFTLMSALCATATSLGQMILYRAAQGFIGGAMVPTVFPVVYTLFPPRQLAPLMVIISLILNLSSTLGPTIGGYLTDTYSWHWLFLVNIVPGTAVAVAVWLLIDVDKPDRSLLRYFDVIGLVLMAVFLGCFEYTLEEGPRWDWFQDGTILAAAVASVSAGVLFFWRVLSYRQPIVDLRAFTNRNFALGSLYTFVIGTGLYGATYVIPLFLAEARGYSSLQIGETVVVTGAVQLVISPLTNMLARKLDLRIMLAIGMALFVVAVYLNAFMTDQESFAELFVPQAVRGIALMFCFLPANLIALGTLPPDKLKNAAGLYNLMRNLGGAISIAAIGTVLNDRMWFHWNRLIEDVTPARPAVQQFLDAQTSRLGAMVPGDAAHAALEVLAQLVQRQALVMSFNDVLLLMGGAFLVGLPMTLLLRKPRSAVREGH
ncbi:MAG TPA: DHA2 family efflux MFS transporter permease subunit [Stellaceae bacterium]|nr:DHA2 family efflux MFS transporter permease subunit [Stellaceae bacterium]